MSLADYFNALFTQAGIIISAYVIVLSLSRDMYEKGPKGSLVHISGVSGHVRLILPAVASLPIVSFVIMAFVSVEAVFHWVLPPTMFDLNFALITMGSLNTIPLFVMSYLIFLGAYARFQTSKSVA